MTTKRPRRTNLLLGGIHSTAHVDKEPQITLSRWRAVRLADGDLHLYGWHEERGEGRVSSAVTTIDKASAVAITSTGRRYVLAGPPGMNLDAGFVLHSWLHMNGLDLADAVDVSAETWEGIQHAQRDVAAAVAEQGQAADRKP